jgi:SAM-dependent methyltransferase
MITRSLLAVLLSTLSCSSPSFAMSVSESAAAATAASLNAEDSVNLQRWAGRWSENNLGWHREYIHPSLKVHGDLILPPPPPPSLTRSNVNNADASGDQEEETWCLEAGATAASSSYRIFVPLCGKSLDMAHMASLDSVSQVVGLDGIEKALLEFAKENPQLEITSSSTPNNNDDDTTVEKAESASSSQAAAVLSSSSSSSFKYWNGKKIQLIQGDFFHLDSNITSGRFDAIYDRASMVAIEPALRLDYVATMGRLIQPGGKILLVVIERDDDAGPPFSVTYSHVQQLYEPQEWVESITALQGGRDDDDRFVEGIYLIQAKK